MCADERSVRHRPHRRALTWVGVARSVPSSMARNVVCISHVLGAGGDEIGRLIAGRLGFLYVDEELIGPPLIAAAETPLKGSNDRRTPFSDADASNWSSKPSLPTTRCRLLVEPRHAARSSALSLLLHCGVHCVPLGTAPSSRRASARSRSRGARTSRPRRCAGR
jgi:hypothetical protein